MVINKIFWIYAWNLNDLQCFCQNLCTHFYFCSWRQMHSHIRERRKIHNLICWRILLLLFFSHFQFLFSTNKYWTNHKCNEKLTFNEFYLIQKLTKQQEPSNTTTNKNDNNKIKCKLMNKRKHSTRTQRKQKFMFQLWNGEYIFC